LRIKGLGFRIWGLGFRVKGSKFRALAFIGQEAGATDLGFKV